MVNVVVGRKRTVKVSTNATAGVIDTSVPVTLKNAPTLETATRFDHLVDVVANNEIGGAVPVYDENTDKYIVKKLTFSDVGGDLDGGEF